MTPEQEAHVKRIEEWFAKRLDEKYQAGAREHGGDLWGHGTVWLLEQALDEALDNVVYILTALERVQGKRG